MTPGHINWDEYFMFLAILVSLRSKDPNTKVGAVLVKNIMTWPAKFSACSSATKICKTSSPF